MKIDDTFERRDYGFVKCDNRGYIVSCVFLSGKSYKVSYDSLGRNKNVEWYDESDNLIYTISIGYSDGQKTIAQYNHINDTSICIKVG